MRHLNIGGSAWLGQFTYDFPISGALSRKYLFPRGDKMDVRVPARGIPESAPARFRERSATFDRKNDPLLCGDAMEQVDEGWPLPLLHYPSMVSRWSGDRNGIKSLAESVSYRQTSCVLAKQLPVDPADQSAEIIAPRRPGESRLRGFVARTQICGAVADFARYSVLR